jgi:drug/metabolite transporter (DMT)-like permease
MSGGMLLLLLIFNGITYCAYNVLSFFVLYRTDLIIHAILNVCRRMTIIVFTACFFQVHVTPLNALGVALALCGVLLFSMKK